MRCFSAASACRLAARKSASADGLVMLFSTCCRFVGRVGRQLDDAIGLLAHRRDQRFERRPGCRCRLRAPRSCPSANGSVCVDSSQPEPRQAVNDDRLVAVGQLEQLEDRARHADRIQIRHAAGLPTSAFFCVTTPMIFSPGMTSSSRFLLFGRPTFSGMTVPGKTTMLRIGRMGSRLGIVEPLAVAAGADRGCRRRTFDDRGFGHGNRFSDLGSLVQRTVKSASRHPTTETALISWVTQSKGAHRDSWRRHCCDAHRAAARLRDRRRRDRSPSGGRASDLPCGSTSPPSGFTGTARVPRSFSRAHQSIHQSCPCQRRPDRRTRDRRFQSRKG